MKFNRSRLLQTGLAGCTAGLLLWFWPAIEISTIPLHLTAKKDRLTGCCLRQLPDHFRGQMWEPGGRDWDYQVLFRLAPEISYQIRERPRLLVFLLLAHQQRLASRYRSGSELRFNLGSWPLTADLEVWIPCEATVG